MFHAHRYIVSLFLTAILAAPVAIIAAPQPQDVSVRVYDSGHKDYHTWDDNENRAYGQYRTENPKVRLEFSKSSKKQQSQYWNWRHSHPDKN